MCSNHNLELPSVPVRIREWSHLCQCNRHRREATLLELRIDINVGSWHSWRCCSWTLVHIMTHAHMKENGLVSVYSDENHSIHITQFALRHHMDCTF